MEFLHHQAGRSRPGEPVFVRSYAANGCESGAPEESAYVYDQALTLLALLAAGRPKDLALAESLAAALVIAQRSDRSFRDGRLRNAYAAGGLPDPACGCARIPGRWNAQAAAWWEDEYAAGSDTGNMAWAGIALLQAQAVLKPGPETSYLSTARGLARWIAANTQVRDAFGGFRGGLEGFETAAGDPRGQRTVAWRSTEHNIDLVAFFELLAEATGGTRSAEGRRWHALSAHAARFVESMANGRASGGTLATGVAEDGLRRTKPIPLDVQVWPVLALPTPRRFAAALDWALDHCGAGPMADAFDFDCGDGDGAWWEGTAQVAAALGQLGRREAAEPILARLRAAQLTTGAARGAWPAASKCGLTTGFTKTWGPEKKELPWIYTDRPHVGATAWAALALLGRNPFRLAARPPQPLASPRPAVPVQPFK